METKDPFGTEAHLKLVGKTTLGRKHIEICFSVLRHDRRKYIIINSLRYAERDIIYENKQDVCSSYFLPHVTQSPRIPK